MAHIEAGDREGARAALRPFAAGTDDGNAAELRYLLGRAWFDDDKAMARYLFEEALAIDPAFEEAGRWEARCGSALEDLEDFRDDRHPTCNNCHLHYRDHEPLCPYCGSSVTPPRDSGTSPIEDQLREAGKEVLDSLRNFSERDDVQKAREKAVHAGQQAYAKAREIAESENARKLKDKAGDLGKRTAAKAREISERKEVKQTAEKAASLGKDAAEKARAFAEREDVKQAVHQAGERSKKFLDRAQHYIEEEQARINIAEGGAKALLIGKWVILTLVVLYLLKWLFVGDAGT